MTLIPPPDPGEFEPDDLADIIAAGQVILIAMLVIALILLAPIERPEWFHLRDTSGITTKIP